MTATRAAAAVPPVGESLLHPVVVCAVAVLVVNDHAAKAYFANAVTGKVSDVAGLVFFPLVLTALVEAAARLAGRRGYVASPSVVAASVAATAVVFTVVKASPVTAAWWSSLLGYLFHPVRMLLDGAAVGYAPVLVRADATDLVALAALWVPWRIAGRRAAVHS